MNRTGSILVVCLGTTLMLTGCGEVVFKRGAGPGSMASAQSACRASTKDEQAYIACMEGEGYLVKGSQDSVFVDGPDTAAGSGKSLGDALFVPGTAAVTAAAAKAEPPATPVAKTATPAPVVAPAAVPAPALDPLEQVDVASWWKLGGSPDQLKAAQDRCVASLGNAHRPDSAGTKVTRAMIGCLKEAGWRGIGR